MPSPVWEQKLVAVLAVEFTFPTATEGEAAASEPWRAASRWEQALVATVQGFGGVMLQRSPSLLLAAFGIPQTLEQLPQRAVQAALALRQLVAEGADREPWPALRSAVHWGPLLVDVQAGNPTAQLRALGDTLARPVRLLGQAAAGEILLSPELGPLVEGWCELQAREVPLPGRQTRRISVYAVVGNRPQWPRLGMRGLRPLTPFVGRDRELALLRELLRQVEGSRGQVVGIIGEPGVGKSRLCYEFIRGSLPPPWLLLETQGSAYGQATPYLPVVDLLKGYFRIDERDDLPTIRHKVIAKLRCLDDAFTPTAPAFLTLLDVPVEDPPWQALEASQRRQRTLDAVKRLLLWESQRQPVLLIIENLHWIDTETQAVLDTLIESLPAARLFLLATYRPEYHHNWGNKTYYTQLRLDPLPRESARALVNSLLGEDAGLQPLGQRLLEWTHGNPFFLEESVRTLIETQVLVGERGAYRLVKARQTLQVPATVQAVLAARMDRLPAEEKRLLHTAAVIGKDVPFAVLQAIAELSEETLHCGLAHLQTAEFLYETRLFPELEHTFKHTLTHEVAYGSLPQERRRTLHAQIVEAIDLRIDLRNALSQFRDERRIFAYLREAEALAQGLNDQRRLGQVSAYLSSSLCYAGDHGRAVACGQRALVIAEALGDFALQVVTRFYLGQAHLRRGEYRQAIDCLRWNIESLLGDLLQARLDMAGLPAVVSRAPLAIALAERGEFAEGIARGEEGLRIAEAVDHPASLIAICHGVGELYLCKGDLQRAIPILERGLGLTRAWNILTRVPGLTSALGSAYALCLLGAIAAQRNPPERERDEGHYRQALALAEALGMRPLQAHCHHGLGTFYTKTGRPEQSRIELSAAIELFRSMAMTFWLPQAEAALAMVYSHDS